MATTLSRFLAQAYCGTPMCHGVGFSVSAISDEDIEGLAGEIVIDPGAWPLYAESRCACGCSNDDYEIADADADVLRVALADGLYLNPFERTTEALTQYWTRNPQRTTQ